MAKERKNLVKSGLALSLMTFASRIMGLVREMTKATFLGTSAYADVMSKTKTQRIKTNGA